MNTHVILKTGTFIDLTEIIRAEWQPAMAEYWIWYKRDPAKCVSLPKDESEELKKVLLAIRKANSG